MSLASFLHSATQSIKTALNLTPRFQNSTDPSAQSVKIQFNVPNSEVAFLFVDNSLVDRSKFVSTNDKDPEHTVVVKLAPGDHVLRIRGYGQPNQKITIGISEPAPCKWSPQPDWKCRASDGFFNDPHRFTVT